MEQDILRLARAEAYSRISREYARQEIYPDSRISPHWIAKYRAILEEIERRLDALE